MSIVRYCPNCGRRLEFPAFEGDGVFGEDGRTHHCSLDELRAQQRREREAEGYDPNEAWGDSYEAGGY